MVAGLLLAGLSRIGVEVGARRRSRAARQSLRMAIARVSDELVLSPVQAELERCQRAGQALATARG